MFCTKCGSPITDDAKFCTNCGNAVQQNETASIPLNVAYASTVDIIGRELTFGVVPETKITIKDEIIFFEQSEKKQEIPLSEITGAVKFKSFNYACVIGAIICLLLTIFWPNSIVNLIPTLVENILSFVKFNIDLKNSFLFMAFLRIMFFACTMVFGGASYSDKIIIHQNSNSDLQFYATLWDENRKDLDSLISLLNNQPCSKEV